MRLILLFLAAMGLTTLCAQQQAQVTPAESSADSLTTDTKVATPPSIPTLDPGTLHRKPTEEPAVTEEEEKPVSINVIAPSAYYEETMYDVCPRPLQQIQSDPRTINSAIYNLLGSRATNARFRIVNRRLVMVE